MECAIFVVRLPDTPRLGFLENGRGVPSANFPVPDRDSTWLPILPSKHDISIELHLYSDVNVNLYILQTDDFNFATCLEFISESSICDILHTA